MDIEHRLYNIADNLIAAFVFLIVTAVPFAVYDRVKASTDQYVLVILATALATIGAFVAMYAIAKRWLWGCTKTRCSIGKLRACLHSLPPGLRPAIAQMSTETAQNLCNERNGENITLAQYMKLISDVSEYRKVLDVTYIAVTAPSEWGRKEEVEMYRNSVTEADRERHHILNHLWNRYFDSQKTRKQSSPSIRMRRLLLFDDDCPAEEKASLDYLTAVHEDARIGLLKVKKCDLPSQYQRDLVLILCSNRRKWIIRSDYAPSKVTVNTTVISEVEVSSDLRRLFDIIHDVYHRPTGPDPRLLVANGDNAPDQEFLKSCKIVLP